MLPLLAWPFQTLHALVGNVYIARLAGVRFLCVFSPSLNCFSFGSAQIDDKPQNALDVIGAAPAVHCTRCLLLSRTILAAHHLLLLSKVLLTLFGLWLAVPRLRFSKAGAGYLRRRLSCKLEQSCKAIASTTSKKPLPSC